MDHESLENLRKLRRPVRTQLAKRIKEIEEELSAETPNSIDVKVSLEMLDNTFTKLDSFDQRIIRASLDLNDEEQETEHNSISQYERNYRMAKVKCDKFLEENIVRPSSPSSSVSGDSTQVGSSSRRTYKLPKIEIKKFNGELKEWLGFWSQFEKIHSDEELHNSDKFQYLVQSIVPGTRADKLVSSYPQSAANYPLVIAALKDRFGNNVLLTEVYVRQLLRLVIRNANEKKPQDSTLCLMYDELESNLRALETLGVTQEQSAAFLYPLVESSLPAETIQAWQRSAMSGYDDEHSEKSVDERLKSLMKFLKNEVRGAERLSYVTAGFIEMNVGNPVGSKQHKDKRFDRHVAPTPTAASLFGGHVKQLVCVFCDNKHDSEKCVTAQTMPFSVKKRKITDKKACLTCLKVGHVAKACKSFVKCLLCQQKHVTLMCPELSMNKKPAEGQSKADDNSHIESVHSKLNCTSEVLLQTLRCTIRVGDQQREVRVLLDAGSQKSYILEKTAKQLGARVSGEVRLCHLLFGGLRDIQNHNVYEILFEGSNKCQQSYVQLLGHKNKICDKIPRMPRGPWLSELKEKGIYVNDIGDQQPDIEVLIGADYYANWLTGRKLCLNNGLVALETCFGWTVSGKLVKKNYDGSDPALSMQVVSLFVAEAQVADLWSLEAIGIREPAESCSRVEKEKEVKERFLQSVIQASDGRYVVKLPWTEERPTIPDNREIAMKRLRTMTDRLIKQGKYSEYSQMFNEWTAEGMIEAVTDGGNGKKSTVYYLPHRAVFKPESTTTPVRPVFDASCKSGPNAPSLNELLEKGPNLLELLPTSLLRFRANLVGISSDIRRAFQMIEVDEGDRNYLRFLWWEDESMKSVKTYRHKRVVFGVNCSPFLLAAVLELHLHSVAESHQELAHQLLRSLYVDNCATSVNTYAEYETFKVEATQLLSEAKMQLRNWESTLQSTENNNMHAVEDQASRPSSKVLGLVWDKINDTLSCEIPTPELGEKITKRMILSFINQLFDPVGFLCPAVLPLKLLLQEAWTSKLGWDEKLPYETSAVFQRWLQDIQLLKEIKICRSMTGGLHPMHSRTELHAFCDASQSAYAAVVYLRTISDETDGHANIAVQLLAAKSRLSPLKKPTIPRMELLACTIGARLTHFVYEALNLKDTPVYLWSDSTTALSWIRRNLEWGTFVGNRVKEISSLTKIETWRHVPGKDNPADLPSRGCSPKDLLSSRWWEGPSWLCKAADDWPTETASYDEAAILLETKGLSSKVMPISHELVAVESANRETKSSPRWYITSSRYIKNVRVVAWIRRFEHNAKQSHSRQTGNITAAEFGQAEFTLIKLMQQEELSSKDCSMYGLIVEKCQDGLYRVKTRLSSQHSNSFICPVLLPPKHPLTEMLIQSYHMEYSHAGVQFLMCKIRERFWIPQARRLINRLNRLCTRCIRHSGKNLQAKPAVLLACRTEITNNAFQTTGVDLAGPLFLKGGGKAWLVLFTCAVYRCIHLDFVTSLSTEAFLSSLERFINMRGRPSVIYSDNGTNFTGAVNLFDKIDWKKIEASVGVRRIQWIFNPPTAAWWGGWWERLVRTVKDLLKRMLGNARLNYDQLRTSLSHIENVVNERPLTVVTEDQNDLIPLTPAMFLRGISLASFPEGQHLESSLSDDYRERQSLQHELKRRFLNEYLSQLVQRAKEQKARTANVGDLVLVGSDDKKRLQWPLARIIELLPGKDGVVRTARMKTQHGILLRPIQRLYPLEVSSADDAASVSDKLNKRLASSELDDRHDVELQTESVKPTVQVTRVG